MSTSTILHARPHGPSGHRAGIGALVLVLTVAAACQVGEAEGPPTNSSAVGPETGELQAFTGARIFDGTGSPWIEDGVLLVEDGIVRATGPAQEVDVPPEAQVIDLEGRWLIPGLVNAHGHSGGDREAVLQQLETYGHYGVTTVVSLGGDTDDGVQVRDEQWSPGLDRARLFVAGPVINPGSPEEAREDVAALAAMDVDWVKFRVDDFLGQAEKMAPEVYETIIHEARERNLPVAVHIYQLEDAKGVVEAGADVVAHSVRDGPVDQELIDLLVDREVCYTPTLMREVSTFVYAERPEFFDDPFFLERADPEVIADLEDPETQAEYRESSGAQFWREALPVAEENMVRLHDAGVPVAMGTDTGPYGRFQGYFEHLELERMVNAGMTPVDVLLSTTGQAAACMGLGGIVGTLEPGAWADFLVLDGDPTQDILNTRELHGVWIAGNQVR